METNFKPGRKTITLIAFFIMILSVISISIVVKADETTGQNPTRTGDIDNDFSNPENAMESDNTYATAFITGNAQDYSYYGFVAVHVYGCCL